MQHPSRVEEFSRCWRARRSEFPKVLRERTAVRGSFDFGTASLSRRSSFAQDDREIAKNLVNHGLIGDLQPAIDDLKRLAQLLLVDAQRRVGEESVPPDEGVEALLSEEASQSDHLL